MSDILMKGTEPIGQVSGLTADNVEYSSGVSVKDALDNKVSKTGDTIEGNLDIDRKNGTAGTEGNTFLNLGNNIPKSSVGNSTGNLRVYGDTGYGVVLNTVNNMTGNQYVSLPNKSGTIALISDTIPKQSLGNITSSDLNNAYTVDFIKIGYLQDSGLPLYGNWGVVICVAGSSGTTKVCNQVIIAQNGIATRHYEGSSWSAWKKTSFS